MNEYYVYQQQRPYLFMESGQLQFIKIRDKVKAILKIAGAIRMDKAIIAGTGGETGGVWEMLACVDRLVEIGELKEIQIENVAGQYRIFIAGEKLEEEEDDE